MLVLLVYTRVDIYHFVQLCLSPVHPTIICPMLLILYYKINVKHKWEITCLNICFNVELCNDHRR